MVWVLEAPLRRAPKLSRRAQATFPIHPPCCFRPLLGRGGRKAQSPDHRHLNSSDPSHRGRSKPRTTPRRQAREMGLIFVSPHLPARAEREDGNEFAKTHNRPSLEMSTTLSSSVPGTSPDQCPTPTPAFNACGAVRDAECRPRFSRAADPTANTGLSMR